MGIARRRTSDSKRSPITRWTEWIGIYDRSEYLPGRKAAMELWNNHLDDPQSTGDKVAFLARG